MMTGCRQSPGSTCARRGMGRLWRGMGGGRPPRRQHGLLGFHQPRITQHGFPLPSAAPRRATPSPACGVFTKHETRNTNHGRYAFLPTISHDFPAPSPLPRRLQGEHPPGKGSARRFRSLLSCALWRGIGRLWRGMGGRRPPRRQHGMLGFHQPRDTQHVFPLPSGGSKESSPKSGLRGFHETRNTRHESRLSCFSRNTSHGFSGRPATAFLCVVARHGAAMARHGRRPSPAPATRPVVFSPATNQATCFSLALRGSKESSPKPGLRGFHESRITKHESRPFSRASTVGW